MITLMLAATCIAQEPSVELGQLIQEYSNLLAENASQSKRRNAIYRIGMSCGDEGVKALKEMLPSMLPNFKTAAVHSISLAESDLVFNTIKELSTTTNAAISTQALRCLAHIGIEGQEYLSSRWRHEDDPSIRLIILQSLLNNDAVGLESLVIKAANDDNQRIQLAGLEGIGKIKLEKGFKILRDASTDPIIAVRRAAFSALGEFGGKKAFRALISAVDDRRNDYIMGSVLKALNSAETSIEVKEILKALNTRDTLMQERMLEALAAAARHQPELAAKGLRKSLASNEFRVRSAAIRGLVVARPEDVVSLMLKRLNHGHSATRTDALWALSVLGNIPASAELKLIELTKSKDGPIRLHATAALGWLDTDSAHATCLARLTDDWWAVRSAAVSSLLKMRRETSVQQLIAISQREAGRVKSEAINTLSLLTGMNFGANVGAWRAWWGDRRPDYSLPSLDVAIRMVKDAQDKIVRNGDTGTYHGMPVPAGGVIFVLDTSGSMGSRFSSKETYLAHFVEALKGTLKNLPASQPFGIVLFGSSVRVWKTNLVEANQENIKSAISFLSKARAAGGTNLFDAVETAILMEDVQTVFLLTDGQPTMGKRTATSDILNELGRLNRDIRIQINTIAAGSAAADFMRELAEASGGEAVDLTKKK